MLTREEYEAKRQKRLELLRAAAARAALESNQAFNAAHQMSEAIPFGQPILIGHHSEKPDRAYRSRIDRKQRQGYELHQKAEALKERAASAAKNRTIFSDDPDAQEKIADKIARLEERQSLMVKANKLVRKNDRAGLLDLGFTEAQVEKLFHPDFAGRLGFPDYALVNNSANIRRLKARSKEVAEIQAKSGEEVETIGNIRIVKNFDINRLQIIFPGKPAESIRSQLKSHGFHWSPSEGAWQRFISPDAEYWAKQIVK